MDARATVTSVDRRPSGGPSTRWPRVGTIAIRAFVVAVPLVLAVVLWWHPAGGADVFEGVRHDVEAWLFVHVVFLLWIPLLGVSSLLVLRGIDGAAATLSRLSLIVFLVFYTAYEVSVGVGTGILVDYANGLSPADQAVVADAIQHYNRNPIVGDPASVALIAGVLGWTIAMGSAAVALHRAGAGRLVTVLTAMASVFVVHPPPVGPVGLTCLAIAAARAEQWRAVHLADGVGSRLRAGRPGGVNARKPNPENTGRHAHASRPAV